MCNQPLRCAYRQGVYPTPPYVVSNIVLYATFPYYGHVGVTRTYPGSTVPFLHRPCMSDMYHTQIQIVDTTTFYCVLAFTLSGILRTVRSPGACIFTSTFPVESYGTR